MSDLEKMSDLTGTDVTNLQQSTSDLTGTDVTNLQQSTSDLTGTDVTNLQQSTSDLTGTDVTNLQQSKELKNCDSAEKLNFAGPESEVPIKKRRQKPNDDTVLICQICGDKALSYNFNAVTCESCKAFFRRNALKSEAPVCSFGGKCQVDKQSRKICSGCRLKKCFDVGMMKEWILDSDELEERRKRCAASAEEKKKLNVLQLNQTILPDGTKAPQSLPQHNIEAYHSTARCSAKTISSINTGSNSVNESRMSCSGDISQPVEKETSEDILQPLTSELRDKMCHLHEAYMAIFGSGFTEDQMKKIVETPRSTNDLWTMSEELIHMVVRFVRKMPEFKCLDESDQVTLLKGSIMEVVVFQSAMFFDTVNHKWKVAGKQYNEMIFVKATVILKQLGETVYEEHLTFAESFKRLTKKDGTIISLMFLIMIFNPDMPRLKNTAAVIQARDKFSHWLQIYLRSIVPMKEARKVSSELLKKLLVIRRIGDKFAEITSTLDVTSLEPLVLEVFDLKI